MSPPSWWRLEFQQVDREYMISDSSAPDPGPESKKAGCVPEGKHPALLKANRLATVQPG